MIALAVGCGMVAGGQAQADPAVVGELQRHVRPGQRDAADGVGAVGEFGAFALQELAPRRGIESGLRCARGSNRRPRSLHV